MLQIDSIKGPFGLQFGGKRHFISIKMKIYNNLYIWAYKDIFFKLTFKTLKDILGEVSLKLFFYYRKKSFEIFFYYYSHINNKK